MILTLKQLGNYCAVHDVGAIIDGDRDIARVYDNRGVFINTLYLRSSVNSEIMERE
jgi:hypothetical protein